MYSEKDWIKAISNLMKKTQDGEIIWRIMHVSREDIPKLDDKPGDGYQADANGFVYRIFSYQTQEFSGEYEQFYWVTCIAFKIYDGMNNLVARCPHLPIISDLFEIVERRQAFTANALRGLL